MTFSNRFLLNPSCLIQTQLRHAAVAIFVGMLAASTSAQSHTAPISQAAVVAANYGNLPLSFEANRGQADPSIKFLSRANGYSLLLTDSYAELLLSRPETCPTEKGNASKNMASTAGQKEPQSVPCSPAPAQIIQMTLAGTAHSSHSFKATGEAELPGRANYFLGNDPSKWHAGVPTYARVRYAAVYTGVDLIYYGNQHQLEYDFVVAPEANPAQIQLNFSGQEHLKLAANGDLILEGNGASATLRKPVLYQENNGQRQPVSGSFKLLANNTVTFAIGGYDHSRALVIDPVLVYSTYLGGSGTNGDQGNGIAVDSAGNAYVVGTTHSTDFPVTGQAFQTGSNAPAGTPTVFVTKLNASGNALLYSTYLGGTGGDFGYGIAIDKANNVYVTGATYSADFPVTCGAFQTANPSTTAGASTAFVAMLNPESSALTYSTYLGGSGNSASGEPGDVAQAIAVDSAGNAYVTGYTSSSNFPVSDAAFQVQFLGDPTTWNAFVTKLNPSGTELVYSTYLGGGGAPPIPLFWFPAFGDSGNAIAIDAFGDAFVAGSTASSNFPVTSGAFQTALAGPTNAFVTELNPAGTEQIYSTYLGGSGQSFIQYYFGFFPNPNSPPFESGDGATAIAVDSNGFVYVAGNATSSDFPVTAGALEGPSEFDTGAGFVAKLKPDGSALVYSTYLEGLGTDISGLAVDGAGSVYLAGNVPAVSAGFPAGFQATPDALATPVSSGVSAFLVKLDPSATVFNYATLLGGGSNDEAIALALDSGGNAYVTGSATSVNFPVTNGALQTSTNEPSGGSNAFVSKFGLAAELNQTAYPAFPPKEASNLVDAGNDGVFYICGQYYEEPNTVIIQVNLSLSTNTPWPPPTGTLFYFDDLDFDYAYAPQQLAMLEYPIANPSPVDVRFSDNESGVGGDPRSVTWNVGYPGDAIYASSAVSGTFNGAGCLSPPPDATPAPRGHAVPNQHGSRSIQGTLPYQPVVSPGGVQSKSASYSKNSNLARLNGLGPKFSLPPAIPRPGGSISQSLARREAQSGAACIAPKPVLTVTTADAWRIYGAANPKFAYKLAGLAASDTVTVTPTSATIATSAAGSYPILATVTGSDAEKYTIAINPATLSIHKAPLHVEAKNAGTIYGQTPPPLTGYSFYGFLNGDTASAVSGAPVLTSADTNKTPVGTYPITVQLGTLSAANYAITTVGNGQGSLWVYKATLVGKINNQTMHQGNPVPPLTYTLTGFVNGDTAASSVTGTPVLSTTATSTSPPGKYPITGTLGTLASHNYDFTAVNGVMTVLP
jgi:hypothetical protein